MILIDGEQAGCIDAADRGLAYGDGLFETMAVRNGRVLALEAHLARFTRDAARLGLEPPSPAALERDFARLGIAEAERAVLKLILTRGSGGRGYRPPSPASPRRITSVHAWPAPPDTDAPRLAWICRHPIGSNPATAGIKHLNRLDQVLASAEWPDANHVEGLMCDADGALVEATRSNVFLVHGETLVTPVLDRAGVAGVVRAAVLEHAARLGVPTEIRRVERAELDTADELFVTSSVLGVCSITALSGATPRSLPRETLGAQLRSELAAAGTIA